MEAAFKFEVDIEPCIIQKSDDFVRQYIFHVIMFETTPWFNYKHDFTIDVDFKIIKTLETLAAYELSKFLTDETLKEMANFELIPKPLLPLIRMFWNSF